MSKRKTLADESPKLAQQWHPTKNGDLKPSDVALFSAKKVWWLFRYDDPETGKHFDFEWQAVVSSRVLGADCPYLSGRAAWPGYNDLATKDPELAKEWHPTKNGDLKPTSVALHSGKKVWWLFPYDDPETGLHFDFEWQAVVCSRVQGAGCPYLGGHAAWPGYNDLATKDPELAKEWHPTKNGDLKPTSVALHSSKKVWWLFPYDDPETGLHFDFEWRETVDNRSRGYGCPYLSGNAVWSGYNDLNTKAPKLSKEWHPTKNGDLKPTDVSLHCNKKVWWLYPYDDPETGKHFDFEWEEIVNNRFKGYGCPYLSGNAVWPGYNDLATKDPELAKEWHPTKNGDLKPTDITLHSGKKVWWLFPYDDPETGLHFDFEWRDDPNHRANGRCCPYLSSRAVWPGYNDLATKVPELVKEWHPTKNGDLMPTDVTPFSNKKVWWLFRYDDPETGKYFDFEWQAVVFSRVLGADCPYLSGRAAWPGYNDLATKDPELAKEWHPTKNGELKPTDVTLHSGKKVWWFFPYDDPKTGLHFDFEWRDYIYNRAKGLGCPYLSGQAVWAGYNDLATKAPKVANEWHPTKNRKLTPDIVFERETRKRWWRCKDCYHTWRSSVYERVCDEKECPNCKKKRETSE